MLCVMLIGSAGANAASPQYRQTQQWHVLSPPLANFGRISNFNGAGEICYGVKVFDLGTGVGGVLGTSYHIDVTGHFGAPAGQGGGTYKNIGGAYGMPGRLWFNNYFRSLDGPGEAVPPYGFYDEYDCRGLTDSGWMWGSSRDSHDADAEKAHAYNIYTKKYMVANDFAASHVEGMAEDGQFIWLSGSERWPEDPNRFGYIRQNGVSTQLPWALTDVKFNSHGNYVGQKSHQPGLYSPVYDVVVGSGTTGTIVIQNANPHGISDDMRLAITKFDLDNHGVQSNYHSGVLVDGQFYDYHDITQELPSGMQIQDHWMRSSGEVAEIGKMGTDFYVLRLTAVPEPTSLAALGAGGLALLARRFRRARVSP